MGADSVLHKSKVVLLASTAGIIFGLLLFKGLSMVRTSSVKANRIESTRVVLQHMGTIETGQRLADFEFEDLKGKTVRLAETISRATWICVIDANCESCVEDINWLTQSVPDSLLISRFVILSRSNPRFLEDIKHETGLGSVFLYDHRGAWCRQYNIFTFPFHILVDANLIVLSVVSGNLTADDLKDAL